MRPTPQTCSECGQPFMGSDGITLPTLCPKCKMEIYINKKGAPLNSSKMKVKKEAVISEKELRKILIKEVEKQTGLRVTNLIFITGVRGDYDRGDAKQYVEKVICELE